MEDKIFLEIEIQNLVKPWQFHCGVGSRTEWSVGVVQKNAATVFLYQYRKLDSISVGHQENSNRSSNS